MCHCFGQQAAHYSDMRSEDEDNEYQPNRKANPRSILSDGDPQCLSELWKALFDELKVKLLYSTAYHPQTDGSSERTIEIALRFYLHAMDNPALWPATLPKIQAENNNSRTSLGKTLNEICYGFSPTRPLDLVSTKTSLQEAGLVASPITSITPTTNLSITSRIL